MFNLYLIGKLDNFKSVFDVDNFYKFFRQNIRWALLNKDKVDMPEIINLLKKKKEIKFSDKIFVFYVKCKRLIHKIIKKLFH